VSNGGVLLSSVAVCWAESSFVQVIVPPAVTATDAGANLKFEIFTSTAFVAALAGGASLAGVVVGFTAPPVSVVAGAP
jgi:hypothetical protein